MNKDLTLNKKYKLVHQALKSWGNRATADYGELASLTLVKKHAGHHPNKIQVKLAINSIFLSALEQMELVDQDLARLLRLRFIEGQTATAVANHLNDTVDVIHKLQRKAINRLAEVIWTEDKRVFSKHISMLLAKLPAPTYQDLVGLETVIQSLSKLLTDEVHPLVLSIVGIGGIGKTALAHAISKQTLQTGIFTSIAWVRYDVVDAVTETKHKSDPITQIIPKLAQALDLDCEDDPIEVQTNLVRDALKTQPTLAIIDNLEQVEDVNILVESLKDFCNPSKLLITSRAHVIGDHAIHNFVLNELSKTDAFHLLKEHAKSVGFSGLNTISTKGLEDLYATVGGNPLALKLIISLLDIMPLPIVLEQLKSSVHTEIELLYTHIYWQSWISLSTSAKLLLISMPIVSGAGGTIEYLMGLNELTQAEFWPALQELRRRSLIEVRGNLEEKRFGVHRLTESFLQTEILKRDAEFGSLLSEDAKFQE